MAEPVNKASTLPRPWRRLVSLVVGPVWALAICLMPASDGLTTEAWRLVALVGWMVFWWLGEAVPIPATALLPIPMMPIFGIADMTSVGANYGHPLIFLFMGGFLLAAAMQRWGLHRRVALKIISVVGTRPGQIVLGFMIATAFLSMWISNTATTVMMFAVGLSVVEFVTQKVADRSVATRFGVVLMLGVAYAASIGGVGTLIGTPPNAMLASFLESSYGLKIDFFTWMMIGVPIVFIMLPIAWVLLTKVIFPLCELSLGDVGKVIGEEKQALGRMSAGETAVAIVFTGAAVAWMLRKQIVDLSGLPINDTAIAISAALILFLWPISLKDGIFALEWRDAKSIPWGVLLLFGGGLAIAGGFQSTGLAAWIGDQVSGLQTSTMVLILVVTIAIVYLTEITSNTASTATFLPILGAVAVGLALDPRLLSIPVALGASMAFMMPVATPPNAIVFSYEEMQLRDMVIAGFWLNICAIIIIFTAMYFLVPMVFGLPLSK